jgi:2'-5' RNA ligase
MNKVYNSAVVIIPSQEQWTPIQKIREKYDRQIHRWMPHITLLYPFRPENNYNLIENDFLKICESFEAFHVKLKQFNFFNHGKQKYTLWLVPEPKEILIELQKSILKLVPDCNDVNKYKNGFTPHLSVGQIQGRKNLEETINVLQNDWRPINFQVQEINFISREKSQTSKFEIKKRIPLKK